MAALATHSSALNTKRISYSGSAEFDGRTLEDVLPDLASISYVQLTSCSLAGSIPPSLALSSVSYILLNGNALSGMVPDLSACVSLKILNLSDNALSGFASPGCLSGLAELSSLSLNNNQMSGSVPELPASISFLRLDNSVSTVAAAFDFSSHPLSLTIRA
jgi:Leucine-rich repeat (LRR) protein